ncbi:Mdg1p SKDI_14G1520 [Saccharomyces kudriavzevii IFO 1802]|uniref:AMP-activated protein kinase glycogen-binding domain-containing protein n=1 Tax=Saccharomyces kudriavzevii (strain ATCC MYA-4449 / AS 2.2408 / CBS 8840 / NBRC 1802 / NCYC 2889) TaxID=226230 RepID=A0AA35J7Q6_SACK1|nr:uncharacterized protein SKDI_14G1520 [Saccharomyces kudriavzevii IFO 1802]CAI4049720.1 hypothetical protein SKDI_14G1520 [Saccharomyces kudriavzevii IFO 1802]
MQSNLPQFTFKWPKGPKAVILTGAFDEWKGTLPMVKDSSGAFEITLPVKFDSPDSKLFFKFIVDGQWLPSKDYKVTSDEAAENNFITKEDITQQYGNSTGMLVPESAGLAVSKNSTLIEPEEGKPVKLRRFKIKRVIKTNKKTGESSIFSQEVTELHDSEDEEQQVNKNGKNIDDSSGTATMIENNIGAVNEEKSVKPYEEKQHKVSLVRNEESITDLGKTQSSDSRLFELSAEELEKEEEEEEEEQNQDDTGADAEVAKIPNEKPLNEATNTENPQEDVAVGAAAMTVEETHGKPAGEVTAKAQILEAKQKLPAATAKEVEVKRSNKSARSAGTNGAPREKVQESPAKKGGFFRKLSQLLK